MNRDLVQNRLQATDHPVVYEVNTRVVLNELSRAAGKRITLDILPDWIIEKWAGLGTDAVWLMGVWTTGELGVKIAREHEGLRAEYKRVLPDVTEDDIIGSPYSIRSYTVAENLGGNKALLTLRKRLEKKGLGLILDFVCNHTARDSAWVAEHPEYYVQGKAGDDVTHAERFFRAATVKGERVIAFGRDPHFPGWTDTAQLNPRHPEARRALITTLGKISEMCDGLRCDMAMLALNPVFADTWGELSVPAGAKPVPGEFWNEAITTVRGGKPGFLFIAEAYWDLEWRLQQMGFDYTYDKTLYDRLLHEGAGAVYGHLQAEMEYQRRLVRFIENHDEFPAAAKLPNDAWHSAAAVIMASIPGMVLLQDGQIEGRKAKLPVQLGRRPEERPSPELESFYKRLLTCINSPVLRKGKWKLLPCRPSWQDNQTWRSILAFWWHASEHGARLVIVNYAPQNAQAYVEVGLDGVEAPSVEFRDLLGHGIYVRERGGLLSKGMYFDLPGYGVHFFDVIPVRR